MSHYDCGGVSLEKFDMMHGALVKIDEWGDMGRTSDARERLIKACGHLMHVRGYTAVGISEICAEAGVQKGSFYHFFSSKRDLALAVIDGYAVEENQATLTMLGEVGSPLQRLEQRLKGVVQQQLAWRATYGQMTGCLLGNLILEMSTQEPSMRVRLREAVEESVDGFKRLLTEAVSAGELAPLDVEQSASCIQAMIEGAILMAKMRDDPQDLSLLRGAVFRLLAVECPAALEPAID